MRRSLLPAFLACLLTSLLVSAQVDRGRIHGFVRDSSGAVLPGVQVEASSEVLIERERSVLTDANGEYRLVDLPPGQYSVTFTLPGFQTVKRDGVNVMAATTLRVDAELKVGAIEETISVV